MHKEFTEKLIPAKDNDVVKCLLVRAKSGKYDCLRLTNLTILQDNITYYTEESVSNLADQLNKEMKK